MLNHQRLCAWLHISSGLVIMVLLSGTLAYVAMHYNASAISEDVKSLLGAFGLAVGTALCIVAGLELVAGVAFLASRSFGRPLLLLSSVLQLANVPLGTALGIYSFWALLGHEARLPSARTSA